MRSAALGHIIIIVIIVIIHIYHYLSWVWERVPPSSSSRRSTAVASVPIGVYLCILVTYILGEDWEDSFSAAHYSEAFLDFGGFHSLFELLPTKRAEHA